MNKIPQTAAAITATPPTTPPTIGPTGVDFFLVCVGVGETEVEVREVVVMMDEDVIELDVAALEIEVSDDAPVVDGV
jgi:hypothetical protein